VIVPELPPRDPRAQERIGRFVQEEAYPVEDRIAERRLDRPAEVDELRRKSRAARFAMLNMPPEHGGSGLSMLGQVAIEEESGKATNGLGFAIVDRAPARAPRDRHRGPGAGSSWSRSCAASGARPGR
jgi:alkylation response protein AidB-like acyl-CoA dehydrogenase